MQPCTIGNFSHASTLTHTRTYPKLGIKFIFKFPSPNAVTPFAASFETSIVHCRQDEMRASSCMCRHRGHANHTDRTITTKHTEAQKQYETTATVPEGSPDCIRNPLIFLNQINKRGNNTITTSSISIIINLLTSAEREDHRACSEKVQGVCVCIHTCALCTHHNNRMHNGPKNSLSPLEPARKRARASGLQDLCVA